MQKAKRQIKMNQSSDVLDERTLEVPTHQSLTLKTSKFKTTKCGGERGRYLHKASDVLLFLEEVLIKPAPVGDQLQYFTLPEEGVFALLLAPAASAAIGDCSQGDNKGESNRILCVFVCMCGSASKDIVRAGPDRGHEWT